MTGAPPLEAHRPALFGHCYRMLGSNADADDAVQETMIRAWRRFERFEGRSSLRTWLYRIATNVCLDQLGRRDRRVRPLDGPRGTIGEPLVQRPREHWLEPVFDRAALPDEPDPARRLALRQSIRLAFVAALQHLPPRQRAALLLVDVLGWTAAETAEGLGSTVPAINSALQRARATLRRHEATPAEPLDADRTALLDRYVAAFERYDVDGLTALLHEDATLSMPPFTMWLQGPETIGRWLAGPGLGCKGSRLVPTLACGQPAFGQYRLGPDGHFPWALIVLDLSGDRITEWVAFLDTEALFPRFGLPPIPPPGPAEPAGRFFSDFLRADR